MNPEHKLEYGVWSVVALMLALLTDHPSGKRRLFRHWKGLEMAQ